MKKILTSTLIAGFLSAGMSSAAVTTLALYRMGENGSLANGGAVDSSGNGRDVSNAVNDTGISISTSNPAPGSTAYSVFDGSTQGFYVDNTFAPSDNFGIEAWVKVGDLAQDDRNIFSTGGNSGGLQLYYNPDFGLGGALASSNYVGDNYIPSSVDEWVHLAIVRDGGVTSFYVNGVLYGGTSTDGIQPASTIHLGVNSNASGYFNGSIDEARIFSFNAGEFSTSDLLIPEPSAILLGVIGAGGWLMTRRRAKLA